MNRMTSSKIMSNSIRSWPSPTNQLVRIHVSPSETLISLGDSLVTASFVQLCTKKRTRASSDSSLSHGFTGVNSNTKRIKMTNTCRSTVRCIASSVSEPSILNQSTNSMKLTRTKDDLSPRQVLAKMLGESSSKENSNKAAQHQIEFKEPTEVQISAYGHDVVSATRSGDIAALREMHDAGRTLQCSNQFGESLLHMACRRGSATLVSFLLNEAKVSPRVKDDFGRTPMHDACWRTNPEYEIVELLLSLEPRLASVVDARGHTPFDYARKEHWTGWRGFLDRKKSLFTDVPFTTEESTV